MAQMAKMEVLVEIQSAADKFYEMFRNKLHLMATICPQQFKQYSKLSQDDGNSVGSVRLWTYVAEGDTECVKETTGAIDDESKTLTFNMLEGNMMKYYKSFKPRVNVTGTGQGSLVKWTVEFEKQNESVPDPVKYKAFLTNWSKNVDAYLANF